MSREQFKFRTRGIHLPKEHIDALVILDGAMTLLTTEVVERTTEESNIPLLRNYFDQYHLQPKCVQAFMTPTWELFYNSLDIRPISLGPNTPWPNRAETAVRLIKRQVSLTLNSIKTGIAPASLKVVTCRQLVKAAATARNLSVTCGGVTPLELAFGRRPAELVQLEVATPPQLTIPRAQEEVTAGQIRHLVRRGLAQHLRLSSKPVAIGDKMFYWSEDKSKIKPDASKGSGGMWFKRKVISTDGTMVGIGLGTRLLKVNITKIRKDETLPPSKPGLDAPCPEDDLVKDIMAEDDSEVPKTNKRLTTKTAPPEGEPCFSSGLFTEDMTCDSQHANWNCATKGKIHVLEVVAGSARLRQCCALTGLKVGIPIDIRTGFDVMTSKGRQMVLDIIREQQPDVFS